MVRTEDSDVLRPAACLHSTEVVAIQAVDGPVETPITALKDGNMAPKFVPAIEMEATPTVCPLLCARDEMRLISCERLSERVPDRIPAVTIDDEQPKHPRDCLQRIEVSATQSVPSQSVSPTIAPAELNIVPSMDPLIVNEICPIECMLTGTVLRTSPESYESVSVVLPDFTPAVITLVRLD